MRRKVLGGIRLEIGHGLVYACMYEWYSDWSKGGESHLQEQATRHAHIQTDVQID